MSALIIDKKHHSFYKTKENSLYIDKRLKTYDYEIKTTNAHVYLFALDHTCMYSSRFEMKKPKHLEVVFPADLTGFIKTLIDSTKSKSHIQIHVKLNDVHVLFSACQCLDNRNEVVGIMIHEVPFSNVQNMNISDAEVFNLQGKLMLDERLNIVAVESYGWKKWVTELLTYTHESERDTVMEKYDIDNLIGRPYGILLESPIEYNFHSVMLAHVASDPSHTPLRYCVFKNTKRSELTIMYTISCFRTEKDTCLLITNEVIESNDIESDRILMKSCDNIDNDQCFYKCTYCDRICSIVSEAEVKNIKQDIMYYHLTIPPLFHYEMDVPCFGKRGRSGQHSCKMLITNDDGTFSLWLPFEKWKKNADDKVRIESVRFCKTMCVLCRDEWNNFFNMMEISSGTVTSSVSAVRRSMTFRR